ncbi:hypothetical protein [Mitsuaria sp. GD03876]|uniref:hypothetical protein n=1 Tax=Mitsuaria sp. GD03876 TaxID=2975399 RepID=UPI002446CBDA|nr:hypothetical protein [Mitsuaria sp. GD03876]MDH0867596.1 hypothetical protein [Mitsuaria sp. GD03876]
MSITRHLFGPSMAICLGLISLNSSAFQILNGPVFANGGTSTAEFAFIQADGQVRALAEIRPGSLFGSRDPVPQGAIRVTSNGRQFELDDASRSRQARDLRQSRQAWVFDGEQVCVLESRLVAEAASARCPKIPEQKGEGS